MTDPIVIALSGLQVATKTSLSTVLVPKLWNPNRSLRMHDFIAVTVVLKAPGQLERSVKMAPQASPKHPIQSKGKAGSLSTYEKMALLAAAGRTRVDLSVRGRRAALTKASSLIAQKVASAMGNAVRRKDYGERWDSALRAPMRQQSEKKLRSVFEEVLPYVKEAEVRALFRTVRSEAVVRGVLDA